MKKLIKVALFLYIFTIFTTVSSAEEKKCILWKVSDSDSYVYLLGSIHVVNKEFYPLNKAYVDAYDDCNYVVVEADPVKSQTPEMQMFIMKKGLYKGGQTLLKSLSEKTKKEYQKFLTTQGINSTTDSNLKPWLMSVTLLMQELMKMGFDPQLGIDNHFLTKARKDNKPIMELESGTFQINLLSGFSDKMQDEFLFYTLQDIANLKNEISAFLNSWKNGDTAELAVLLNKALVDHPELKDIWIKLFDDRNVGMAEKVKKYLKENKRCLVIAGAGHMLGEKGVVELLEKEGFKSEQVKKIMNKINK